MTLLLQAVLLVGQLPSAGRSPAQAAPKLGLTAEVGPEYDSNATRLQLYADSEEEPVRAALLRMMARGELQARLGRRHFLALSYGGGVKAFLQEQARDADEAVHHGSVAWAIRTPAGPFFVEGSYYDAFQRQSLRDFRTGSAGGRLALASPGGPFQVSFRLGYQGLQYKPSSYYNFHALTGGSGISWRLQSGPEADLVDWRLRLDYRLGLRRYQGNAVSLPSRCFEPESGGFCVEDAGRHDFNHRVKGEIGYWGNAEALLWYSAEINRSNSYGETYLRHAVGLKFTAAVFWKMVLSVKGVIQLSRFRDPFLVSEVSSLSFVNIDDENRSSLVVQLGKDLTDHWTVILRNGLYLNESSARSVDAGPVATPSFLRDTLFLGIRMEYGP